MLGFDPFRGFDRLIAQTNGALAGTARAPRFMPMDLYRTADHYVLTADLPGVDPGSVDLAVDQGTLTVTAERTAPEGNDVQWLTSERPYGTYRRHITLGEGINVDGISADYRNGVLSVTIPLADAAQPRQISIAGLDAPTPSAIDTGDTTAEVVDA